LLRRLYIAIFYVGIANFLVFWVVAGMIGGDALSGKVEGGRYYLSSHGRLTEVSAELYTYSLWHTRSIFITHPLAILAGLLEWLQGPPKGRG
jgi:hypothetical protein